MKTLISLAFVAWLVALCPCRASDLGDPWAPLPNIVDFKTPAQEDPCAVSPSGCNMGEEKIFREMDRDSQKQQQEEQQRYINKENRLQQEEDEDEERQFNEEDDRRIQREEEDRRTRQFK